MTATTSQMLAIGEEISLEADGHKANNVHIRGWRDGSYMLLEPHGASWMLKAGSAMIGRFLFKGTYYGFETSVIGLLPEVKLLVLSFPANTVETAYRKEKRCVATIPVVMHRERDKEAAEYQGMIINISKGGCRILCSKRFTINETIILNGILPNVGELKDLNFQVAHAIEQNGKYQYGGGFITLREAHKSALNDFFEANAFFNEADRVEESVQTDSAKIPIGDACTIQAGKLRYRSIFRGFDHPKYVLMDMPIVKGKPITLQHHELCVVRFQNAGIVYGFEAQVLKQYSKPVPLWVLNYSGDMERVNLRSSTRVQTFLPATLISGEGERGGAIVDFSVGGCQFVLNGNGIEPGSEGFLRIDLPDGAKIAKLPCEVKNIRESGANKFAGLVFSDMEGSETKKMNSFYSLCKEWIE